MRISVNSPGRNVFDAVGGRPFFDDLVARFYAQVETDPILRPLYPDDLTESMAHTAGFLAQYWGGGTVHYSDESGHPRLRMRHGHVRIGQAERDAWFGHMSDAVRGAHLPPHLEQAMVDYFDMASTGLINAET
ncbi:MAG: globin [Acidimicrobiales bacterium]